MTDTKLIEALAGVAKAQAALFLALAPDDFERLQNLQACLGEIVGLGMPTKPVMTWETLPSQLLLLALASPGPNQPTVSPSSLQYAELLARKPASSSPD